MKKKRPLYQVLPIAQQVKERLEPHCDRIEIAGSLRREELHVGDIELVAIPKLLRTNDLFGEADLTVNKLHEELDMWMEAQKIGHGKPKRWGSLHRQFLFETRSQELYQVDLFMCTELNWGNTLLIRTGSQKFSKWIVTKRELDGAMPAHLRQCRSRLREIRESGAERALSIPEEHHYFDAIGVNFIPPNLRKKDDADQWKTYMKDAA